LTEKLTETGKKKINIQKKRKSGLQDIQNKTHTLKNVKDTDNADIVLRNKVIFQIVNPYNSYSLHPKS